MLDKISKGRRELNASAGISIRKNGICIAAVNLIFCTVVVPILTFSSEILILSEKDRENLMAFSQYLFSLLVVRF